MAVPYWNPPTCNIRADNSLNIISHTPITLMPPDSAAPEEHDEETLVLMAAGGDEEAFGVLYLRHHEAIYRYVYFRVGNVTDAEDLTGDVFFKAWEALGRYRPGQYPFTSWLYRIAHNLTIDYHRKRPPASLADAEFRGELVTSITTEDVVERREELLAVASAIRRLDGEEQQVVILRFIEGLSHQEVAVIIGKSNEASRVILHRALGRLSRLLDEQGRDDGQGTR